MVAQRERVRDGFGLKTHARLRTCVDTGFDDSTHYPVEVGCPDGGEYDAEDGDKVGNKKDVGTARPTGQEYHQNNHRNVNGHPEKAYVSRTVDDKYGMGAHGTT